MQVYDKRSKETYKKTIENKTTVTQMMANSSGSNYKDIHCVMVYREQNKCPHDAKNNTMTNSG